MNNSSPCNLSGYMVGSQHHLPIRIYYEDTDFSGVVYHASYLRFMERGRSDFLRLQNISHRQLFTDSTQDQSAFVVRHMNIDFHKPAHIDDVILVTTNILYLGGAKMKLAQEVLKEKNPLIKAEVTIGLVNLLGKPQRFPRKIQETMKKLI